MKTGRILKVVIRYAIIAFLLYYMEDPEKHGILLAVLIFFTWALTSKPIPYDSNDPYWSGEDKTEWFR